jgi:hypothetical protein
MPFLYHARPRDMRGDVLYPLNVLRTTHPDLYDHERARYAGRELLLTLRIPVLDVFWNDAVHLSPFHPFHLAAAWRAAGLASSPAWDGEFYAIPPERIDPGRSAWFASGALPVDDVTRFDPAAYEEPVRPPPAYHEYLRNVQKQGGSPRRFAHVPHVLVAAPIDVAGLSRVRADRPPG